MFFYVSFCSGNLPETRLAEFLDYVRLSSEEARPYLSAIRVLARMAGKHGELHAGKVKKEEGFDEVIEALSGEGEEVCYIHPLGEFRLVEVPSEVVFAISHLKQLGHNFSPFIQSGDIMLSVCEDCLSQGITAKILVDLKHNYISMPVK